MQLHRLISHDGQQLADFPVSPVRTCCLVINTSTQVLPNAVLSHLHETDSPNVCRVQEGKLGWKSSRLITSVSVNARTMPGKRRYKTVLAVKKTISVSVCGIFQSIDLSRAHEDCWLTSPARQSNNGPCGVSSDFRPANRLRPSQALLYLAGALA